MMPHVESPTADFKIPTGLRDFLAQRCKLFPNSGDFLLLGGIKWYKMYVCGRKWEVKDSKRILIKKAKIFHTKNLIN